MHMLKGELHPSTIPGFRGTRDPEPAVTHLRCRMMAYGLFYPIRADLDDDITIARAFILFIMGYLCIGFTSIVGLVTLLSRKMLNSWPIRVSEHGRGNKRKTNDQATNLFMLGRYHINHHTIETITRETWLKSSVSEIDDVLTGKLLSCKRMLLQVPNGNCKYYLGDRCWRQLTGEARIPLDPQLSMSPHISPATLQEMRQVEFLDLVTSASVHSLSQDFSLPGDAEGPDLGWRMEWTGRREMLLIARLRDPPPISSSHGTEELWHLTHGMRRLARGSTEALRVD
ncbi:hypothetical protein GIB67_027778 [Kingdonia uniflora]|uniref:Uncharacterized protein n=1 Tax=Kingdonia uniflora TaxID=39325 RepID=A0A7J7PCU4_9MAGN|nr:hypothetical protein GIB67_027778 [Kingdonia uniflora]